MKIDHQKLPTLNKRKNALEKNMNRALGTCGTITKDVTFVSLASGKERRKRTREKNYLNK